MARPKPSATPAPQVNDVQAELADGKPVDEAREGLKTIGANLVEFDKTEAGLQLLETRYKEVIYPVATGKGMQDAKLALKEIDSPRIALEHARQAAKRPVLTLGRLIDSRAQEITARLVALADPIRTQVTNQEQAEKRRLDALVARVQAIRVMPLNAVGRTVEQLQVMLDELDALDLPSFQELREQAAAAQLQSRQQVAAMHKQAVDSEAAAEQLRLQKERDDAQAAIRTRIAAISANVPMARTARTSATIQKVIDAVRAVAIDDSYGELKAEAAGTKALALEELDTLLKAKQAAEIPAATAAPTPAPTTPPVVQAPAPTDAPREEVKAVFVAAAQEVPVETRPVELDFSSNTDGGVETSVGTMPERPSDDEIVDHLADHFDDHPLNIIDYLATMDFSAQRERCGQPSLNLHP